MSASVVPERLRRYLWRMANALCESIGPRREASAQNQNFIPNASHTHLPENTMLRSPLPNPSNFDLKGVPLQIVPMTLPTFWLVSRQSAAPMDTINVRVSSSACLPYEQHGPPTTTCGGAALESNRRHRPHR